MAHLRYYIVMLVTVIVLVILLGGCMQLALLWECGPMPLSADQCARRHNERHNDTQQGDFPDPTSALRGTTDLPAV